MLSNLTGFFRPHSIAEALALLEKNSGSILIIAGGTKLTLTHNAVVRELVDITHLGLNYVQDEPGALRMGATTTLQTLVDHPGLKEEPFTIIAESALMAEASRMVRNVSTLGGELVTTQPNSLIYCTLLAMQAQIRIAGGEEFALPLNIFLNKKGLEGGFLIETLVPKCEPGTLGGFASTCNRNGKPTIAATARLTLRKGICHSVKLAMTGSEPVPMRLYKAEERLEGARLSTSEIQSTAIVAQEEYAPVSDDRATAEYRNEVGGLMVKKALLQIKSKANV